MTKTAFVVGIVGAAAMGWRGSSLESRLGIAGSVALPVFAIGLIFLAQLPSISQCERIKLLEADRAALRGKTAAPASQLVPAAPSRQFM